MSLNLLRVGRFVAVLAILATTAWLVVQPAFADTSKYGWNDWDSHAAYRYITTLAIVKYNTLPWWNPYFCGGFPGWAYVEGATNLVSPYFPFYLFLSTGWALRVEMLGSTALGCVSTYLLAGRFSQSVSLRTLATVLYALNGRWALQLSEGHTWHLQYAWLPLAVYLFDRGIVERRPRFAVACGLVMALMVYMGAIYPLPHTGLILIAYALLSVLALRRSAPVGHLVIAGLVSLGFAAPKLLPMLDLMLRTPRTVDSPEAIELSQLLVMFTARFQNFYTRPVPVPAWEWHEWGIYIGWSGVVLLACGFMLGADRRQSVVRAIGILLLLLGLGSFHPYAPWTLLHRLPPFTSQHVPSRFHYPAVLFLSLAGIAVLDRLLDRAIGLQRRPWVDLALLLPVALIGLDVGLVGREAMRIAFVHDIPKLQANISPAFEQLAQTPLH